MPPPRRPGRIRVDPFRSPEGPPNRLNRIGGAAALAFSTLSRILARKSHTHRAGAIFVTSRDDPRIRAHFRRLKQQTEGLLDLSYVINRSDFPEPDCSLSPLSPQEIMPRRMRSMLENGGIYGGFVDVLFVPLALALKNEFVWIIEYDVDFSGDWRDFSASSRPTGRMSSPPRWSREPSRSIGSTGRPQDRRRKSPSRSIRARSIRSCGCRGVF